VGFPLSFFGLVNLPPLAAPAPPLKESAQLAHVRLGYLLLALLAMHVAAALHHQFVKRDGTLSRMLPRLSQATRRPVTWRRLLAMLALIAPTMCRAAPIWTVLPADSSLRFQVSQAGGTIEGSFKRFDARIAFDPADLATSHVEVSVDITSVTTGAAERDQELPKPDWFDVVRFPRAMFTADRFRVQGDNSYVADGMLTLRDIKLPISLPFTLEPQSDGAVVMQGTVDLDRVTFGIGQGQWATSDIVGHNVTVIVRLRARRPG
jgi:polyisoprenoid-binding protein YceI